MTKQKVRDLVQHLKAKLDNSTSELDMANTDADWMNEQTFDFIDTLQLSEEQTGILCTKVQQYAESCRLMGKSQEECDIVAHVINLISEV